MSTTTSASPIVAVNDIGTPEELLVAIDATIKYFNDGDLVSGIVVKIDRDEVLLDIGYKTEGVIPSRELSIKHDIDPSEIVKPGDRIEALVLQKEDKEGRLILSKKRAQYERAWGDIEKVKNEDGIVKGHVIEVVKGGLIVDIGLRGFLPASLVEMRRVRDLSPYIGKDIEAKIIELDKNRNNVVLSRRAWLEQTQSAVRSTFLNQLQKGQIRTGQISSIVNFGAFVDLGGVDGLVHVSELSWKHIEHPSEVVEVGQEVTVEVLEVDMERERVSLSFIRVADGIEGLVHISELSENQVEIPEQVVQVNQEVTVKIIDIDLERRRISLSVKQAGEKGEARASFDPYQYGMPPAYDSAGKYIGPEGFNPETGEWKSGFEDQKKEWEKQYADALAKWQAEKDAKVANPELAALSDKLDSN